MGTRIKVFESTGLAPNGRLYAGDLNGIQDALADQVNFSQEIDVAALGIGEAALKLIRYGAGEARISGLLRTDGILRGLGGIYAGAFTTAQRDAIAAGFRPYGLIILNTTTNQVEWNKGTDAAPNWQALGSAIQVYNTQPTSYTLVLTDAGKLIEMNSSTANTLTVPTDASVAFQIGTVISVSQLGAGQTTLAGAGGVTMRSYNNNLKLAGQNAIASVIKRAANDWYVAGNLVP
jgi:hypothetical protein